MNLPNKLTMGRIFAIPVFISVFLLCYRYAATVIFLLILPAARTLPGTRMVSPSCA